MKTIIFVPRKTFDFITFALETKIMIFFIFVWGRIITRNKNLVPSNKSKAYSPCVQNKNYDFHSFCWRTKLVISMICVIETKFTKCLFGGCYLLVILLYSLQTTKNSYNYDCLSNLDRCETHKKILR